MSPMAVLLYILIAAVMAVIFSRLALHFFELEHGLSFWQGPGVGDCPGCRARLTKENMTEGSICMDGKMYCDACKSLARCGC